MKQRRFVSISSLQAEDQATRGQAVAGEQPVKGGKKRKGALKVPKKASKLMDKWAAAKKDLVFPPPSNNQAFALARLKFFQALRLIAFYLASVMG